MTSKGNAKACLYFQHIKIFFLNILRLTRNIISLITNGLPLQNLISVTLLLQH